MIRRHTRRTVWIVMILALTLIAAACSSDGDSEATTTTAGETTTTAPAKDPIVVSAINQQDGVVAWPEVTSAANAIIAWFNDTQGGVDGHPIQLDVCTAGDEPESTQACAQQLVNDDNVDWIFPMAVPNSDVMFQAVGDSGKPMIGHLLWDIPDSIQPDLYSADPGVLPGATVIIEYLAVDLAKTNVAIVTTDSPFGRDTADLVGFLLSEYGVESQAVLYDEGTADYLPAFASVDLEAADAILFLPFTLAECVPAAEAIRTLGWTNTTISTDFCAAESFVESGLFDGWLFANPSTALIDGNPDRELLLEIFENYGDGVKVDGFAVNGALMTFWMLEVVQDAYVAAGGPALSADNVRQAAVEWSGSLTTGPDTLDCPGVEPFIAACSPSYLIMRLDGETFLEEVPYRYVDLSIYAPLLEG